MSLVKIIRLSDEDKRDIRKASKDEKEYQKSLSDLDNQSYKVLQKVFNIYTKHFESTSQMFEAFEILKIIRDCKKDQVELSQAQIDLVNKILDKCVSQGLIESGFEHFVKIALEFKQ